MAPKKKGSRPGATKGAETVPDSDHIVFARDGAKEKKSNAVPDQNALPKPDARKVIGGQSWTGKLPVTLLNEICQKERWHKPDFSMRQMPDASGGSYRSAVKLARIDPKTKETVTLPPFHLPASHAHLADQPTALEARHFAAAYALFRVSSMKNIHMMLPPQYRDIWKGDFSQLKAADMEDNKAWKYDADPFAADAKRHEIQADIEKRRLAKVKADATPVSSLVVPDQSRTWTRAAKVEMGQQIRNDIEGLLREHAIWNPYEICMTVSESAAIVTDLARLGFRQSHVQEAVAYCKDREETIEWLLVHVPEDDLPQWCLPANYSAGISLASSNLGREAKLQRLTGAGYSLDLCTTLLLQNGDDERLAAESLQETLVPLNSTVTAKPSAIGNAWEEEMTTLEAIFDDRFSSHTATSCSIKLELEMVSSVVTLFRKPSDGYPTSAVPILAIQSANIPAYIRLSATKQAILFSKDCLLGDSMIFGLVEWLETNLPRVMENPGSLMELRRSQDPPFLRNDERNASSNGQPKAPRRMQNARNGFKPQRADEDLLRAWETRQKTPLQQKMLTARRMLPAWSKQDAIIEAVQKHQCVIISGETGSGKSTQSVQFILDHLLASLKGSSARMVCTQPRRISALGLSDRVSAERCSLEGQEVGYVIRGDSKVSADTKITFMTTGVLLRRLQSASDFDTALGDLSHIFVDEVHERTLDTDFLLALIREALKVRKDLKLILMSATLDSNLFLDYFGGPSKVGHVHIEGRTFPVTDYYLDDVVRFTKASHSSITADEEDADSSSFDPSKAIMGLGAGINYHLIADLVHHIDRELGHVEGGILVFLPGTLEIDRCLGALRSNSTLYPVPLHASLTPVEQKRVFPPAPKGKRKVVACTNVAETSITIEDIVAVIDTGRVKETRYDPNDNIVRLEEIWASQAACKQRRGRAGRVRAGYCYKMYTRNVEANSPLRPEPEIRRVPLEQLCLSVKATSSEREPAEFLSETLTPPESGAVRIAMKLLHTIGALENNHLTALGTYLTMIPADLRCAKLIIYGTMFSCLDACLTIASILTVRSPFISPRDKRDEAKEARSSFPTQHGDLLLDLAAYSQWEENSHNLRYRELQDWCSAKFLAQNTLRDIKSTRSQLLNALVDVAVVPFDYSRDKNSLNRNNDSDALLRALIAGALNPQIARIDFPDKKYIASISGAKELDPEAKTIKFFNQENGRVFVHPSSVLFDAQSFPGSAAFISYFNKMATSKTFIRELTPLNAYAMLLFGGPIELDTSGMGLIVDGWFRLRGWARIGVLVSRLRLLLDDALRKRIDNPGMPLEDDRVFRVVRRLLELNGQDR